MLQSNAGRIVFALLCSGLWLAQTAPAQADAADARSVSLGGATTTGSQGTAFAPMYNPAAIDGKWTLMLPGVAVSVGNNLLGVPELVNLAGGGGADVLGTVTNIIGQVDLKQGLRVEAGARIPLLGYTGTPTPLTIMGRPVHFGLNLWGNAGANVSLTGSEGLSELVGNVPTIMGNVNTIQSALNTLPNQVNASVTQVTSAVNAIAGGGAVDANTLGQAITAIETAKNSLSGVISPVQGTVTSLTSALGPLGTTAQSLNANVVADGHLTLALSGKTEVWRNDLVKLSVGTNLKTFIMPSVATIPSPTGLLSGNQNATMKVPPVAIAGKVDAPALSSVNTVTTSLQGLNDAVTSTTQTIDTLIQQARTAQSLAQQAAGGDANAAAQLSAELQNLQQTGSGITNTITSLTQTASGLGNIQQQLSGDLSNISLQTSSFSDVSPVGFGADLGVMAAIGDEWTAGAALENLFVVWPGKEQITDYNFTMNGTTPSFAATNTTERSANYDRSEPRALRLGGAYRPKLVDGLTVAGDLEAVFNGRPVALHLGAEYRVAKILGLRLGTQVGGTGFLITPGLGVKLGGFNLDLGAGINPGIRAAQVALNSSLAF